MSSFQIQLKNFVLYLDLVQFITVEVIYFYLQFGLQYRIHVVTVIVTFAFLRFSGYVNIRTLRDKLVTPT